MAKLRFTIIDYTSHTPISTVVDEPVGLDAGVMQLKRDDNYHGFFGASEGAFGNLQFYGDGYNILYNAYNNFGIDAYLLFTIDYSCDDDGNYTQIWSGRFSFDTYKECQGIDGCYISTGIENGDDVVTFRRRIGQKVSLDSRATFDAADETGSVFPELPYYPGCDQTVLLNPMMIRQLNFATVLTSGNGSNTYTMPMDPSTELASQGGIPLFAAGTDTGNPGQDSPQTNEFNLYRSYKNCISPFTNISAQEFGDFPGPVGDQYTNAYMAELTDANPIFTFKPDILFENNIVNIDIELSACIFNGDSSSPTNMYCDVCFFLLKGITWQDALNNRRYIANGGYKTPTGSWSDFGTGMIDLTANAGLPGGWDSMYPPPLVFSIDGHLEYDHSSLSGCSIMVDRRPSVGPINNNFTNLWYVSPPEVDGVSLQFSYHGKIWMNPGEQLFMFIQVDSHSSMPSDESNPFNPQIVIFSGDYVYRNTYQEAATMGTNKYTTVSNPAGTGRWVSVMPNGAPDGYLALSQPSVWNGSSYSPYLVYGPGTTYGPGGTRQPLSYVKLTYNSLYKPTECSAYMVNEALSRSCEIVSNGRLPVYSDYFGRHDSLPYNGGQLISSPADGPGSLECITNGLQIRGFSPLVAYYMGVGQFSMIEIPDGTNNYTLGDFATYGASADHPNYIIDFASPLTNTLTVPLNSSVPLPYDGSYQIIIQQGTPTGVVTVQGATTGVTIVSPSGFNKTNGQNSQLLLTKIGEDVWLLASKASMFISFQDILDALHSVHAIGCGLEPNTIDGGNWIRVEPIDYFYQNTVVLTCENVDNTEKDTNPKDNISTLKIGYAKWEAEQAQGLDEFLSSRTFRTTLSTLRNGWDKLCKFVASGYAIEQTRRKLGTTTTDWRYDKDNFIMCVQRGKIPNPNTSAVLGSIVITSGVITSIGVLNGGSGYASAPAIVFDNTVCLGIGGTSATAVAVLGVGGIVTNITITNGGTLYTSAPAISIQPNLEDGFMIEQGYDPSINGGHNQFNFQTGMLTPTGLIDSPSGMIDPSTIYNYRISPIRNALRWLRYVMASYVNNWATGKLIFTEGGGNYYASGKLSTGPVEALPVAESADLMLSDLSGTITPVYKNETVKFKYPMGYADWQAVWASPYGLVKYNINNGDWQYGWIQDIKYNLYDGIGEFILKPKI